MTYYVARRNVEFPDQDVGLGDPVDVSDYDDDRIEELLASRVIEGDAPAGDYPHHKGGGYYELSDGTSVQGREAAEEAQAELDAEG